MTNIEQLAKVFEKGKPLTSKDIRKMGIANPTDAIFRLRKKGYCIYTNKKDATTTEYKLGNPNKKMIAYLFENFGSAMFDDDFFA
jgi:Mn-dependent DtxR family transcriptional regulator